MKKEQIVLVTTDAFPNQAFQGKVSRIAPLLSETSREARVEIIISNSDRKLKPGMFIRAEIEFHVLNDVTVISSSAFTTLIFFGPEKRVARLI